MRQGLPAVILIRPKALVGRVEKRRNGGVRLILFSQKNGAPTLASRDPRQGFRGILADQLYLCNLGCFALVRVS